MRNAPLVVDDQLLDRYADGECTPAERLEVDRWAASDPANRKRLVLAQFLREKERRSFHRDDTYAAWQMLADRRHAGQRAEPQLRVARKASGPSFARRDLWAAPQWTTLAACAVLALGLSWVVFGRRHVAGEPGGVGVEYVTDVAQHRSFSLVDGTRVTMAPGSRIRVPRDYGESARDLQLEGEAFFVVVHNADHPFEVRTVQGVVRDVGTSFDLEAYPEDGRATLAVVEGEVAIARTGCAVAAPQSNCTAAAKQGDVVTFSGSAVAIDHPANVSHYFSWMQSRLVYHRAPLANVVRDLERVYSIQITIADSATGRRLITGDFDQAPIGQVLDEITQTLNVQLVHRGRTLVISARPAQSTKDGGHAPLPLSTAFRTQQ